MTDTGKTKSFNDFKITKSFSVSYTIVNDSVHHIATPQCENMLMAELRKDLFKGTKVPDDVQKLIIERIPFSTMTCLTIDPMNDHVFYKKGMKILKTSDYSGDLLQ